MRDTVRSLHWTLIFALAFAISGHAQNAGTPSPFEKRANDVVASINAPKSFEQLFSKDFLTAVPPAKLAELFNSLTAQFGKAVRVQKITNINPYAGQFIIEYEKHVISNMNLTLENKAPFLISGLVFVSTENQAASLNDLVAELKALPGQTALSIVKLDGEKLNPVTTYNADKSLAIGSTFKLYVLAELVLSIAAGERKWSDVVELRESSLPSGQLQNWPQGSPLTLHSLAALMISVSDNTATDQLITTLGRENIEKMMTAAGNSAPTRSLPFLKTIEMVKIKGETEPNFATNYAAKTPTERRQLLDTTITAFPKEKIDLSFLAKPSHIDTIEWFASPNDLARAMNYLRLHSTAPDDKTRGILSINKALPEGEATQWNYVGYKGGSETGVMSMTYLLQSKKGDWYVVSGTWNNDKAALDEAQFAALMTKAVSLLRATS